MKQCPSCSKSYDDALNVCPADGMFLSAPTGAPDPLLGLVLDDRYKILNRLGEGGMGAVYRAEHVMLGKTMAVKVLRQELSQRQDLVKRFQQEARNASKIGQENIVSVTDFGKTPDGSAYFVMEELIGRTLSELVREGPVAPQRALPILGQVCRALSAAHGHGIVHRDLKPDNIFLVQRDERPDFVKILDFGISKMGDQSSGGERLTQLGMVVGTPEYMAPEQATGGTVDHRADIYSFGALTYEMFTGVLPFTGANPLAILLKHTSEMVQPPSMRRPDLAISSKVEQMILRALSKDPAQRQQSMVEMGKDLDGCLVEIGMAPLGLGGGAAPRPSSEVTAVTKTPTGMRGGTMVLPETDPGSPSVAAQPAAMKAVTQPGMRPGAAPSTPAPIPLNRPTPQPAPQRGGTAELSAAFGPQGPSASQAPRLTRPPHPTSGAAPRLTRPPQVSAEPGETAERLPMMDRTKKLIFAGIGLAALAVGGIWFALKPGGAEVQATPQPPTQPKAEAPVPAAAPTPAAPAPAVAAPTPAPAPAAAPSPAAPAKASRVVELRSVPPGATVLSGSRKLGITPLKLSLDEGSSSEYRFAKAGHRSVTRKIDAAEGSVTVKLERMPDKGPQTDDDNPYGKMEDLKDSPF